MIVLLAALLVPLHFTAPADTLGPDAAGHARISAAPVQAYVFQRVDARGVRSTIPGYADPYGRVLLTPHAPGTRETAWVASDPAGVAETVYVRSSDRNGNLSPPSNGCVIRGGAVAPPRLDAADTRTALDVPIVRQSRERCGPAALTMVLRYYNAAPTALKQVDGAYDPVLHGSLITDLADAARRAGYQADIATLTPDELIALLADGVPPIVLYQNGVGPLTVGHFGVVTGWDAGRSTFILHDGSARARVTRREDLAKRWQTAGSQALIVRRSLP